MEHNMDDNEKERLALENDSKQRERLSNLNAVEELLLYHLNNFAYRYFDSDEKIEPLFKEQKIITVQFYETNLANALKTQDKELRKKLIEFAKSHSKKDNPKILNEIEIDFRALSDSGDGEVIVKAQVNWDFPNFGSSSEKLIQKNQKAKFEDSLELRNKFPLLLEEACEVF
ncbi:MAG: hypothetical protein ACPGJV_11950 [Bacteriovoracaceae bacterium]